MASCNNSHLIAVNLWIIKQKAQHSWVNTMVTVESQRIWQEEARHKSRPRGVRLCLLQTILHSFSSFLRSFSLTFGSILRCPFSFFVFRVSPILIPSNCLAQVLARFLLSRRYRARPSHPPLSFKQTPPIVIETGSMD